MIWGQRPRDLFNRAHLFQLYHQHISGKCIHRSYFSWFLFPLCEMIAIDNEWVIFYIFLCLFAFPFDSVFVVWYAHVANEQNIKRIRREKSLFDVVFLHLLAIKIWIFYERVFLFTRLLSQLQNTLNPQDLVDSFGIFGVIGILWLMWKLVKWSSIITLAMDDNIWTQSWLQCPFWAFRSFIFMNLAPQTTLYWGKLSI